MVYLNRIYVPSQPDPRVLRVEKSLAVAGYSVRRGLILSPAGHVWLHDQAIMKIGGQR